MLTLHNVLLAGDARPRLKVEQLTIHAGERVGLLGGTGAGKTTLLYVLGNLIENFSGQFTRSKSMQTALAFQSPESSFFCRTVREELGGPGSAVDDEPVRKKLLQFGLQPETFLTRDPFSLSGGEARRVALAATLHTPDTMLLWDEPTAGLDDDGIQSIQHVLTEHRGGYVIASHDTDFLFECCDRWIGIVQGEIVFDETAEQIANCASKLLEVEHETPQIVALWNVVREYFPERPIPRRMCDLPAPTPEVIQMLTKRSSTGFQNNAQG